MSEIPCAEMQPNTKPRMAPVFDTWKNALGESLEEQAKEFDEIQAKATTEIPDEAKEDFALACEIIKWSALPGLSNRLPNGLTYDSLDQNSWIIVYSSPQVKWATGDAVDILHKNGLGNLRNRQKLLFDTNRGEIQNAVREHISNLTFTRMLRSLALESQVQSDRPLSTTEKLVARSALRSKLKQQFGHTRDRRSHPGAIRQNYLGEMKIEEARIPEEDKTIKEASPQRAFRQILASHISETYATNCKVFPESIRTGKGMNDEQSIEVTTSSGKQRRIIEKPAKEIIKGLISSCSPSPLNKNIIDLLQESVIKEIDSLLDKNGSPQNYIKAIDNIIQKTAWRLTGKLRPKTSPEVDDRNIRTILYMELPVGEVASQFVIAQRFQDARPDFSESSPTIRTREEIEADTKTPLARFRHPVKDSFFMEHVENNVTPKKIIAEKDIQEDDFLLHSNLNFRVVGYTALGMDSSGATVYRKHNQQPRPALQSMLLDHKLLREFFMNEGADVLAKTIKKSFTLADLELALHQNSIYVLPAKDALAKDTPSIMISTEGRYIAQCSGTSNFFADIAQWQGYDAEVVSGLSVESGQQTITKANSHAIVKVTIDGQPYYFDATPALSAPSKESLKPTLKERVSRLIGRFILRKRRAHTTSQNNDDFYGNSSTLKDILARTETISQSAAPQEVDVPKFSKEQTNTLMRQNRERCEIHLQNYFGASNVGELWKKIQAASRQGDSEALVSQQVLSVVARSAPNFDTTKKPSKTEVFQIKSAIENLIKNPSVSSKYSGVSIELLGGLLSYIDILASSISEE